jgi:hypothetical protein
MPSPALRPCKHCAHNVSYVLASCPKCNGRLKRRNLDSKAAITVVLLFVAGAIGGTIALFLW